MMFKKARLTLLISILIGLLIYIIPTILVKDYLYNRLVKFINQSSNEKINLEQISWKWYPFPHIIINNVSFIKPDKIIFHAKSVELVPSFTTILYLNIKFNVIINDIDININQLNRETINQNNNVINTDKLNWLNRLVIKNGRLTLTSEKIKDLSINNLILSDLKLNIDIDFDKIKTYSSFSSNLSKKNDLYIEYDLFTEEISFLLKTNELDISILNKYIPLDKRLQIRQSKINGEIKLNIDKENNYKIFTNIFNSNITLIKNEKNIKEFIIKNIITSINHNKFNNKINISKCILAKPNIKVNGNININREKDNIPIWNIELNSEYADIAILREYIREIFDDSNQPDRLFKYVHSGMAYDSKFKYYGKTRYPLDSELMYYEGKIENCKIYIPFLNYFIDDLSANVLLSNGTLKLNNIIANQGQNKSFDGYFLISVDEKDFFSLNLSLLMDLNTIKRLLYEIYHRKNVRDELEKFSELSGIVKGNLIIGEKLSELNTNIIIDQINVSFKYNRIPWDIAINSGNIKVTNQGLQLNNININLESNKIQNLTGYLKFNDKYNFKFNFLKITLDSNDFMVKISKIFDINKTFFKIIKNTKGEIILSNTEISGDFFDLSTWKYNTIINTKKLDLQTKSLFSSIFLENSHLILNNDNIEIKSLQFYTNFDNNRITINGKLKNPIVDQNFSNFDLIINGVLNNNYYNLFKEIDILDKKFYPKFPIQLDNFKISKDHKKVNLNGNIKPIHTNYSISLNILLGENLINLENLKIYHNNNLLADLELKVKNDDVILLNFSGKLDKSILNEVLMENHILNGQITGNIKFSLNKNDIKENYCIGEIHLSSLILSNNNINILNSSIKGNKHSIELINTTLLLNDEVINYNGIIYLNTNNKKILLNLSSDYLTEKNIDSFFNNNNNNFLKKFNFEQEINFKINNYLFTKNNRNNTNTNFIINDLKGKYIYSQNKSYLEIQSGNLCGMHINGTVRKNFNEKASYFNLIIDKGDSVNFKSFLPCIGFNNTEIEGNLRLNLNVTRKNDTYESGHLYLYSDTGKINRFTLLSKVLTLVNVTYLLENLPDIFKTGFNYKHLEIDGTIRDDMFYLNKSIIKGSGMNLISQGVIDLKSMDLDLIVLVTPLKTIDAILNNLPLLGKILGRNNGAILTYPVSVKGAINDPKINTLPPESIGEAITTLLAETLRLPFKIISPIFKGDTEKK